MSEFLNEREDRNAIRRQLLATASAIALLGFGTTSHARAEDTNRPIVWLELDGQFANEDVGADAYVPPFLPLSPFDAISHVGQEKGPPTIWDEGVKLSFQPDGSDWVISAAVRYGKNDRREVLDNHPPTANVTKYTGHDGYSAYQNFTVKSSESHVLLDFQAGKDFGLGMFGSGGTSVFSAGIRFAQFNSQNQVGIESQPTNVNSQYPFHRLHAAFSAKRKFSGVGPAISWNASANLLGDPSAGSVSADWGLNAAMLFGRQRSQIHHQTTNIYHYCASGCHRLRTVYEHSALPPIRSKTQIVPNLGGFAGVSWHLPNAKVSVGYGADMFFGAVDGGIDSAHRENRGFYGPFASVSVGLGG
jgi:hypothetical protein